MRPCPCSADWLAKSSTSFLLELTILARFSSPLTFQGVVYMMISKKLKARQTMGAGSQEMDSRLRRVATQMIFYPVTVSSPLPRAPSLSGMVELTRSFLSQYLVSILLLSIHLSLVSYADLSFCRPSHRTPLDVFLPATFSADPSSGPASARFQSFSRGQGSSCPRLSSASRSLSSPCCLFRT